MSATTHKFAETFSLGKISSNGKSKKPETGMADGGPKSSWVDRLSDNSNFWLAATKLEDEDDFLSAFECYLKDAENSLKDGSLMKSALSCSCAAKCLDEVQESARARQLYFEAGRLYEKDAESAINRSVRQALWALKEAYANYVLARRAEEADAARQKFSSFADKINPFFHEEREAAVLTPSRPRSSSGQRIDQKGGMRMERAMKEFLAAMKQSGEVTRQ